MQRSVPSQIDAFLRQSLPEKDSYVVAELKQRVGVLAAFLELYDHLPDEVMTLPSADYAALLCAIGTIRFCIEQHRNGMNYDCLEPIGRALPTAWRLIKKLPDQFPSAQHDLSFITDADLRMMIGQDVAAIATDLHGGEWKGATVLAGSCNEALLLYALQETERKTTGSVSTAVAAISWKSKPPNAADLTDRSWDLFSYTAVAHHLNLIADTTRSELDTARDFRNLIHPAKAMRQQVSCDRGTAFVSAGAMEHLIRDLRKNL
jgi:hypothetical protein